MFYFLIFKQPCAFFDRLMKQSCAKISVPGAGKSGIVSGEMRHCEGWTSGMLPEVTAT
jgi:hypothetical protein